jgi:methanogenic corrinoid protein MtbC1
VTRLSQSGGEAEVAALGYSRLVADAQARISCLAEAMAAGRPELLELEVDWLVESYVAREVPLDLLERLLASLKAELAQSMPGDAAELACSYLDTARARIGKAPTESAPLLRDDQPHVELARAFFVAVLEGRREEAERLVLDAFEEGVGLAELHSHVLGAVMAELGRMWQVGEAEIAEEHLASRVVEGTLAVLRSRAKRAEDRGRSVLVASVRGNLHDIGARMVADQFELAGWRALCLGADMPAADVVSAVDYFGASLVALSVGRGFNIRATAELVGMLRNHRSNLPVLVGGRPFSILPDLWQSVGADGSAPDAASAVREGERLVSPS